MTVKPKKAPAASPSWLVLNIDPATKSKSTVRSGTAPAPAPARAWTWTRMVRYVSLYYLVNVIGVAITIDGFRRLGAAGNVDLAARARATGVIAAGSNLRAAASAVVTSLWPTRHNIAFMEFALVTVAMVVYVENTIDMC